MWTTTVQTYEFATDKVPVPDCGIGQEMCIEMYKDYMKSMGLNLYVDDFPPISPTPTNSPRCPRPFFPLNSKGDGTSIIGPPCSVWGGHVELFYWPPEPSTVSGHITAAPKETREAITLVGNTTLTMTSPSVYISFDALTAWYEAIEMVFEDFQAHPTQLESQVGDTYSNYILPMDPEDVSTIRYIVSDWPQYLHSLTAYRSQNDALFSTSMFHFTGEYSGMLGEPYQMDFASLTEPSPKDYFLNPNFGGCGPVGDPACGTIFEGDYKPQLSLPSQLLKLDPAWSSCVPYLLGVYDPPKALTAAKTLKAPAYPTSAQPSLSTPAEAGSMLASPTPYATRTGYSTPLFNTKWGTASSEASPSSSTLQGSSRYHDHESGSASSQLESKQTEASTTTSAEEVVGNDPSLLLNLHASHTSDAPLPVVVSNAHPGSWNEDANAATTSATSPTHDPDPTGSSAETNTENKSRQSSETVLGTSQPGNALSVLSAAYESYLSTESSAALPVVVTSSLPMETSTKQPTVLTLGSTSLTLLASTPGEAVQVGTNTVQPGEQVTLDQQTISYGPSGLELIHAGTTSTYAFDPMPTSSTPLEEDQHGREIFTIGSMTMYKPESTGLAVVDDTTLSVGGSALSMDGQELSLAPSGLAVASGSETKLLPFTVSESPTTGVSADFATLTIASSTITATRLAPTAVVIGESHTPKVGGPAYTADNEDVLTLGPEGLVVGSKDQTSTVLTTSEPSTPSSHQTVITAGGETWTAAQLSHHNGPKGLSIGGTTLYQDGPALTLSGKVLTAASDGKLVVQDSSMTTTVRLPALASQETTTASTTSDSGAESDAEEGQSISKLPSGSETTTTAAASSTQSVRGAGVSSSGDCSLGLYILALLLVLVYIL
ncbi:hypothetical protein KC318_g8031 [Hortaea werneckii]|uniref:Uncharacterized protein n=1 Tax=Hortaea werneckii TaxID=91943 RepID=A0A3M7A4K3_HORWE|nr:hypothetical protein KC334_g9038 [Hortaea werneckii]KAI7005905.1 hypothetical protein KC355_g7994 [Hortaea werneckii]KAI7663917.1 hypothetical protein KC318_g8031 [Hortaea werneckii]RMY22485.1 hypothetical protein D0866_11927 [Hortaea werneckii]